MHTPASVARHPIHPMLVAIPIGLWVFSVVCDLIRVSGGESPNWEIVAWYSMVGGIIGALVAAVPGFIDMLSLPAGLKRIALAHMTINLTVVGLFVANAWMRQSGATDTTFWLSLFSIALLAISGWLGGKMVYVHGVAVESPPAPAPPSKQRRFGPSA
jgi:uncharacterized membrane protein